MEGGEGQGQGQRGPQPTHLRKPQTGARKETSGSPEVGQRSTDVERRASTRFPQSDPQNTPREVEAVEGMLSLDGRRLSHDREQEYGRRVIRPILVEPVHRVVTVGNAGHGGGDI